MLVLSIWAWLSVVSRGTSRGCERVVNVLLTLPPSADGGKLGTKLYHAVNLVVLAGVPAAIATSPSSLTLPLDVVLGLALPLHAHIGMNYGEVSFDSGYGS